MFSAILVQVSELHSAMASAHFMPTVRQCQNAQWLVYREHQVCPHALPSVVVSERRLYAYIPVGDSVGLGKGAHSDNRASALLNSKMPNDPRLQYSLLRSYSTALQGLTTMACFPNLSTTHS